MLKFIWLQKLLCRCAHTLTEKRFPMEIGTEANDSIDEQCEYFFILIVFNVW